MTCGSSASDPHDAGTNVDGEKIRPAFISTDALIHRSAKECGPLAYEKTPWDPSPKEHPFRQRVHLRLAAKRIHYFRDAATGAVRIGKGVWDWETTTPFLGTEPGTSSGGGLTCGGGDDDDDDPGPDEDDNPPPDESGENPPGGDVTGGGAGNDDIGGGPDESNDPPNIQRDGGGEGGDGGLGDEPVPAPLDGGPGGDGGSGEGGNEPVRLPPPQSAQLARLPVGTSVANGSQYKHQPLPPANAGPAQVGPLATPNEIGTPGICGIPANGPVDLRYGDLTTVGGVPTPETLTQWKDDVPVTSRIEFFGLTTANGTAFEVDDTSADARYVRGTGPGGVAFLPSNRGLEDVEPGVTTHRNLETASVNEVSVVQGTLAICNEIDPALGAVDGMLSTIDASGNVTVTPVDSDGATDANRSWSFTGIVNLLAGLGAPPTNVSGTGNLAITDLVCLGNNAGAYTSTLPTAVVGQLYLLKNVGAGAWTIDGNGADTIDGAATVNIAAGAFRAIYCGAANTWYTLWT